MESKNECDNDDKEGESRIVILYVYKFTFDIIR